MTEKEFYEEFGNIDPELIEAAAPEARKGKKILAVRLIAVAACLTVIIISAFMIVPRLVQSNPPDYDVIFFGSGSGTITPYGKVSASWKAKALHTASSLPSPRWAPPPTPSPTP